MVSKEGQPRILYAGDLPIEATSGGQLLLHRLFREYPPDRLMVIHSCSHGLGKNPDKEIPGVATVRLKSPYIPGTRFAPIGHLNKWIIYLYDRYIVPGKIRRHAKAFRADIIITVMHGYFWIAASKTARKSKLPLGIIIHDDWTISLTIASAKEKILKDFRLAYQEAAECFCISEAMISYYRQQTGRNGIMLPTLGQDMITLPAEEKKEKGFLMGYGGSLHGNYALNFINTCHALDTVGGKMIAYTNVDLAHLQAYGLKTDNVEIHGFIPADKLLIRLASMDALYLPMDFSPERKLNMTIAFPSKVPDYLMLRKPLFIHAPEYASVVQWARQAGSYTGPVVTTNDVNDITVGLSELLDPGKYAAAKAGVQAMSDQEFNHQKIRTAFFQRIAELTEKSKTVSKQQANIQ